MELVGNARKHAAGPLIALFFMPVILHTSSNRYAAVRLLTSPFLTYSSWPSVGSRQSHMPLVSLYTCITVAVLKPQYLVRGMRPRLSTSMIARGHGQPHSASVMALDGRGRGLGHLP